MIKSVEIKKIEFTNKYFNQSQDLCDKMTKIATKLIYLYNETSF